MSIARIAVMARMAASRSPIAAGELLSDSSVGGTRRKKHQPKVPKRMKQQNWHENCLRPDYPEFWNKVNPGGDPEN
jgi:hypothetical protein